MPNVLGTGLSLVAGKIKEVASDIITVRTGTVVSDSSSVTQTMVILDNDPDSATVQTLSLVGPLPADTRVMMLAYPPRGLVVIGTFDGSSVYALQAEIDAAEVQIAALQAATADSGWVGMTLAGTWAYYGAPFATPAYRKIGQQVFLKGLVKDGTPGTTISTLPVGYRPTEQRLFTAVNVSNFGGMTGGTLTGGPSPNSTGAQTAGTAHTHDLQGHNHGVGSLQPTMPNTGLRVDITTAGAILHTSSGSNAYQSLDGISFLAS